MSHKQSLDGHQIVSVHQPPCKSVPAVSTMAINNDTVTVLDVTDQMHHLRLIGFLTTFINDSQVDVTQLFATARARNNHPRQEKPPLGCHVVVDVNQPQRWCTVDVVHWNIEETLNLVCMQVNHNHAVNSPQWSACLQTTFAVIGNTSRTWTTVLAHNRNTG